MAHRETCNLALSEHLKATVAEFEERDAVFIGGDEVWKHVCAA